MDTDSRPLVEADIELCTVTNVLVDVVDGTKMVFLRDVDRSTHPPTYTVIKSAEARSNQEPHMRNCDFESEAQDYFDILKEEGSVMTIVADRPLIEADIKLCAIIWYGGTTSMFGWNCPAEIIEVDYARRTFKVKSLDDMRNQNQEYTFDTDEFSPESRQSMVIPSVERVRAFLNAKSNVLLESAARLEEEAKKQKKTASDIQTYITRLDLAKA